MSRPDWTEIGDLFAEALEQPPGERTRFVRERCGARPDLLVEVNRLLAADQTADAGFLCGVDPVILAALRAETVPEVIGAWRVIRPIGTGGMGEVFLAERADGQFAHQVAVKLLKRGMDSDAVLARFLRERQILAGLTHPHIARLLDGGVALDGRPFYVMEFVDGQPINSYCDQHRLSLDQRLLLVRTVCLAVEHAHRNLVVHRDLKPSNILVTADGQPKLLDFGIAKLLSMGERDAPATTLTQAGGRLLTPEYAAPEQFRGGPFTTSTDVYSVGAVLYELLTGERPFPDRLSVEDRLGNLEQEPPVMSSRVGDSEQRRQLAGDLDVIVATALRAAPERRYASMEGLREDLRRHQGRLPVKARPDTLGYRASRFVHRHRTSVIAAAVVTLMVMLFTTTATLQAVRIRRQSEQLAVERDRARHEATTAGAVTDFLVEVFRVSDPQSGGQGETVTARELLDRGADRIETGMSGQPELQASMLGAMGRAYANLEQRERAESLLQRGVELWRSEEPRGSPALVAALQHLAELRIRMRDHAGAEESLREALAIQGRIDSAPARRWPLYVDLASSLHGQGVVDRARAAADTALTLYRSEPLAEADTADLGRLADLLLFTRQWDEMESVYARLVSLEAQNRGPRSAAVALLYNKWAGGMTRQGERAAADSLMRIALAIHRELDPRSIGTARTLGLLAANALHLREYARAESLYREALEIQREQLGDQHPVVAGLRATLADALRLQGRYEEAITEYRRALEGYRRAGGPSLALVSGAEWRLAVALRDGGRPVESLSLFRSAIADFERRYPPDFLTTAQLRREYALALVAAGRGREAEPLLRRAIEVLDKRYGDTDSLTQRARALLDSLVRAGARRPA